MAARERFSAGRLNGLHGMSANPGGFAVQFFWRIMVSPKNNNVMGRHIRRSWFALITKGDVMKLEDVRSIAKSRGIHPGKLSKTELIKTLQADEGNFDCFATACSGECDRVACLWREDCFEAAIKGEET